MTKLHLGCGNTHIPGFINIDARDDCGADVVADITGVSRVFQNVDVIYSSHTLEHLPRNLLPGHKRTYLETLHNWYDTLRQGGELYLSVPDFAAICGQYADKGNLKELYGLLLGGQRTERDMYDVHFHVFDEKTLTEDLLKIGFTKVERYDALSTEWKDIDDYSQAFLPHMDKKNGRLMSLNVKATK